MNQAKALATTKQQKMYQISLCLLSLEESKGHLKWKVTELVRKSKVSRPLIYRYLGSSREEQLKSALQIFCNEFYGFVEDATKKDFSVLVGEARRQMEKNPEAILFYQKWRSRDSFLKEEFKRIEARFRKKLKKLFPTATEEEILFTHSCIHGLVTSPFLNPEQAEALCREFLRQG